MHLRHLVAAGLLMVATTVVGLSVPAGAHGTLKEASPAPGEVVEGVVDRIEITLSTPYVPGDEGRSSIFLLAPRGDDGVRAELRGTIDEVDEDTFAVDIDPLTEPGEYQVTWEVLAADGDVSRSAYLFSFNGPPPSDGPPVLWLVVIGAAVLLAAALLARSFLVRRRTT
jgi:methionine-rich copper-binding protein CopC